MNRRRRVCIAVGAALAFSAVGTPVASAAFPGSNGRIVLSTSSGELFSIAPDGRDLRSLVERQPGEYNYNPAVSADGSTVVFEHHQVEGGDDLPIELATVAIGGGAVQPLPILGTDPSFAPTGETVAFNGYANSRAILTASLDASGKQKIGRGSAGAGSPTFSPDGRWVAFAGASEIIRVDADGSNRRRLTSTGRGASYEPNFSPDGKRIVFARWDGSDNENSTIWTMGAGGSGAKRLTAKSKDSFEPVFSPDGTKILFTRTAGRHGGKTRLYTMNSDGTGVEAITRKGLNADFADWAVG